MIVPENPQERLRLYTDVKRSCAVSMSERRQFYSGMMDYYAYGGPPGQAIYNKIFPHIDTLCAFLYAQETTRFSLDFGAAVAAAQAAKIPVVSRYVQQHWHAGNCDINFGLALLVALIKNSAFLKTTWKGKEAATQIVEPDMIGVLNEDIVQMDDQEAVLHKFQSTKKNLETQLKDHPRFNEIMQWLTATASKTSSSENSEGGGNRLLVSAVASGQVTGNVDVSQMMSASRPGPRTDAELVDMSELWVWDSYKNDYHIVTMADPGIVLFDRLGGEVSGGKKMFLKGEQPFTHVCPNRRSDYFYGDSEVWRLAPLQDLLTERLAGIKRLLDLQADPPGVGFGMFVDQEQQNAWRTPGGFMNTMEQGAKFERQTPEIPADLFAEVHEIFNMFTETSGLSNVVMGRGEPGVRGDKHANTLAQLGSARAKNRALVIEDALEHVATMRLKLAVGFSDDKLTDEGGTDFALGQVPDDFVVKVDGHSSSPAFSESAKDDAFALHKAGAIDEETLIELVQPPMVNMLKIRAKQLAKKREEAEAAAAAAKGGGGLRSVK